MSNMTSRASLEKAGFDALRRLHKVALRDAGQFRFIARILLGLYHGTRFPFDLTDLRVIEGALTAADDGSPRPSQVRGVLRQEDDVSGKLISDGNAPGYRGTTLRLDCEVIDDERAAFGTFRKKVHLQHPSPVDMLQHLQYVHAFAWRDWPRRGPFDARAVEQRRPWLDRATASAA